MSKYTKALGFYTGKEVVPKPLSAEGAIGWIASKAPAVLGGHVADWVTEWAINRWPTNTRGPKFVGGVATVVAAFGLSALTAEAGANHARLMDKLTDGMMGRVSPSITGLIKSFWEKKAPAAPPADPKAANASLDGDRVAVMDAAGMMHASPETVSLLAREMAGIMKADGVEIDARGQESVATSMLEALGRLAGGQF